jgi:hypothetical protein
MYIHPFLVALFLTSPVGAVATEQTEETEEAPSEEKEPTAFDGFLEWWTENAETAAPGDSQGGGEGGGGGGNDSSGGH